MAQEKETDKPQDTDHRQCRFFVSHQQKQALYASEFIANLSGDGIIVDCSSGFVGRDGSTDLELPVHTRLAMTKATAAKLSQLLDSVLNNGQKLPAAPPPPRQAQRKPSAKQQASETRSLKPGNQGTPFTETTAMSVDQPAGQPGC